MRAYTMICLLLLCGMTGFSQSKTTQQLQKEFPDSQAFFFYHNTLRMINQSEDPGFDGLIQDIEKMKFLIIRKSSAKVDYRAVVARYKKEKFEELMSSRVEGRNFDAYILEEKGETKGMLVLANSDQSLYVLDIVGKVAFDKLSSLFNTLEDKENDVGRRLSNFLQEEIKNDTTATSTIKVEVK